MTDWTTIVLTILGSQVLLELVRWLLTRRANKRTATANADAAEIKAEESEFTYLRGRVEFSEQQLMIKEQRFSEQTGVLREAQRELLQMTIENGKLSAEIAALKAERAMKLCERKGCAQRQPKSGY